MHSVDNPLSEPELYRTIKPLAGAEQLSLGGLPDKPATLPVKPDSTTIKRIKQSSASLSFDDALRSVLAAGRVRLEALLILYLVLLRETVNDIIDKVLDKLERNYSLLNHTFDLSATIDPSDLRLGLDFPDQVETCTNTLLEKDIAISATSLAGWWRQYRHYLTKTGQSFPHQHANLNKLIETLYQLENASFTNSYRPDFSTDHGTVTPRSIRL